MRIAVLPEAPDPIGVAGSEKIKYEVSALLNNNSSSSSSAIATAVRTGSGAAAAASINHNADNMSINNAVDLITGIATVTTSSSFWHKYQQDFFELQQQQQQQQRNNITNNTELDEDGMLGGDDDDDDVLLYDNDEYDLGQQKLAATARLSTGSAMSMNSSRSSQASTLL